MSREVMQQALEALEILTDGYDGTEVGIEIDAITALRQALETEQEPVATVTSESGNPNLSMSWWHEPALPVGTKLYTSPPKAAEWVGLTDDEVAQAMYRADAIITGPMQFRFAKEIEVKLKEKNT